MIESPLIEEVFGERLRKAKQDSILDFLQARFGAVPQGIADRLRAVHADKKLRALTKLAARCSDIEAFRRQLPS